MRTNSEADENSGPGRPGRPRAVDLAVYAILLRCVLALAAALALFGAKDEVRRNLATLHPEWSAATLAERLDSQLRSNVVVTIVYIVLVLLIAKFIRDGRNWARWLFTIVAFLVAGDVFRMTAFFTGDNVAYRLLSGLTGVAAVVAIVLLFSPAAREYFRPAATDTVSPLRALFGGRAAVVAAARSSSARHDTAHPADEERAGAPVGRAVSLDKPGADQHASSAQRAPRQGAGPGTAGSRPNGGKRPVPRAKSRKQAAE
jgi:hypothetical protein